MVTPNGKILQSITIGSSMQEPLQPSGRNDSTATISWESLVAGYASGTAGLLVGHPLDSLKVLLQTNTSPNTNIPPSPYAQRKTTLHSTGPTASTIAQHQKALHLQFTSPASMQKRYLLSYDLAKCTLRHSKRQQLAFQLQKPNINQQNITLRSLYNGVGAPLITVGLVQSMSFLLYDSFKQILRHQRIERTTNDDNTDRLNDVAIAAFLSGVAISMVTNPLVTLKIRQQMGGRYGLDFWSAVRGTYNMPGGFKNFYTGYVPHLLCESIGRSVFFVTYEFLKHLNLPSDDDDRSTESTLSSSPTLTRRVFSATCAGIISSTVVYPVDVIRSRMQGEIIGKKRGIVQLINSMWKNEGCKAFVRGYSVSVVRSGPVSAVAMPVYDMMFDFLKQSSFCA